MSIGRLSLTALDCRDPRALGEFYRAIVGGELVNMTAEGDWVRLSTGTGFDLGFQLDPDHEPPGWPDGAQQLHVDIDVTDLDEAEAQVLALGAVKTEEQPRAQSWRVFLDPAGHPFCLVLVDE